MTAPMDLTPRPASTPPAPRRRNRRTWLSIGLLVVVLAAGGIVVAQFLTNSLNYFCNVDEVGAKSGCEVGERMRVQGTVEEGSVDVGADGVATFVLTYNGVEMPVVYEAGDPGGLFQECIPVVVRGVMGDDGVFDGDDIEVKHSNEYEADNETRIDQAESQACSPPS